MGLSRNRNIWWPDDDFTCKCGARCKGETNSMVLSDRIKMVRWCDECGHLEHGRKDPFGYTNVELLVGQLENPDISLWTLNPFIFRKGCYDV